MLIVCYIHVRIKLVEYIVPVYDSCVSSFDGNIVRLIYAKNDCRLIYAKMTVTGTVYIAFQGDIC